MNMNSKKVNPKKREFFNEKAEIWDKITIHNLQKVQYITELLEIQPDDRILDVGAGTGIMIPFYEKYLVYGSVVAVDYSEKMIEVARLKYPQKEHPRVSFLVSDVYDLNYDAEFDLVVCYSCFPHFVDQPLALKILSKALRKGGRIAVAHSDSAKKINGVHMNGGVEVGNDFLPRMGLLRQMMKESGFDVTFERDDENYFICIAKKI
ncbi:MAG: class I SAM-dependent methyltransferase [Candidatus Bathyarchaeia archaeon]|jgi:demethylmenaquinone methyltransferase/2-methoxy-6-polyprenyl-1,4-benzoquinol methylase